MNIQQIEKNYPVEEIKANGIPIWPYLRIYIADYILSDVNRQMPPNAKNFIKILSNLFYGLYRYKRNIDVLMFSFASQRKHIEGKFIDRLDFAYPNSKSMIIEMPIPHHYNKKELASHNIASQSLWILKERVLMKTMPLNFSGKEIIENILDQLDISIDYISLSKRFLAQKKIMDLFLKRRDLKALMLISPYTKMGYVYSAKMHNIPVIEFQHGVINEKHFAYNLAKNVNPKMHPDYLLTWGMREKDVFNQSNKFINSKNVFPVGHFYIDYLNQHYKGDLNLKRRLSPYNKTIAFTAQNIFEKDSLDFLKSFALSNPKTAIVYIPRDKTSKEYSHLNLPDNILFDDNLNCYEIMFHCNFHCTVNSSCAIEAPCMGIKNILININNQSKEYYDDILDDTNTHYANTIEEYTHLVNTIGIAKKEILINENSSLIIPNYQSNVKSLIPKLLNQ